MDKIISVKPWELFRSDYSGETEYKGPAISGLNTVNFSNPEIKQDAQEYKPPMDTVGYQPPFSNEGIDPLLGVLETADYLTAAPIRSGTMEAVKSLKRGDGPWNLFKSAAKGVVNSYANPMTAPTGKDISRELGLSEKGLNKLTGDQYAPSVSPAGVAGFALENMLDPTNLIGAGLFGAGVKAVGKLDDVARAGKLLKKYPMAPEGSWWGEGTYKKAGGGIVEMSPDEFLEKAAPLKIDDISRENIEDLKKHMLQGKDLDPLTLYKIDRKDVKASDGRHRAIAAKELGINKVPVVSYVSKSDILPRTSKEYQDNLANWFGDSKVVDKDGKPLVVYHGTRNNIEGNQFKKGASKIDAGYFGQGHYFTKDPKIASSYAHTGSTFDNNGNQVLPVYLDLKNPLEATTEGFRDFLSKNKIKMYDETPYTSELITKKLSDMGYDGVIIDGGQEIIAFKPTQIKSATGNKGTFDPKDPNILRGMAPIAGGVGIGTYKMNKEDGDESPKEKYLKKVIQKNMGSK